MGEKDMVDDKIEKLKKYIIYITLFKDDFLGAMVVVWTVQCENVVRVR